MTPIRIYVEPEAAALVKAFAKTHNLKRNHAAAELIRAGAEARRLVKGGGK